MIRNINENYGSGIIVADVDELKNLITECEYDLPEDGLVEGRDYEKIDNIAPDMLYLIENSNGSFVTVSSDESSEAEEGGEEVNEIRFVGVYGGKNIYALDRINYGSYNRVQGLYVDLYSVAMYEHDDANGEAVYLGNFSSFGEYVSIEIDS